MVSSIPFKRPWSDKISNWHATMLITSQSPIFKPFSRILWDHRWNLHDDTFQWAQYPKGWIENQARDGDSRRTDANFTEMNGEVAVGDISGTSGLRSFVTTEKKSMWAAAILAECYRKENCLDRIAFFLQRIMNKPWWAYSLGIFLIFSRIARSI